MQSAGGRTGPAAVGVTATLPKAGLHALKMLRTQGRWQPLPSLFPERHLQILREASRMPRVRVRSWVLLSDSENKTMHARDPEGGRPSARTSTDRAALFPGCGLRYLEEPSGGGSEGWKGSCSPQYIFN